ncbi:Alpha/beta hydrolase fold-1 [Mycena vitilis]|nr:Alpha/beta hydrolase fold-1 [Mycena vitilis]
MKSQFHVSEPSPSCPFRVEGVQYIPQSPREDGRTLIFLHAMSLHKTFEPMLEHLLATSTEIKDVWSIDNPNHGRSSVLNQKLLAGPSYREYWSAAEYARAAHSFLSSSAHGIDFSARSLVGLAHSSGVAALMMLLRDKEFSSSSKNPLRFTSLILLDPALLPPQFPSTTALSKLFGKFAASKRDQWPSRAAAHTYLAAHPAFKAWDPRALRLFEECALRDTGSGSEVVLACSRAQEAAFYLSPTADYKARPVEIFVELARGDELPIHIITCLKDEYKGQTLPSKEFQIAQVKATPRGSVQVLDRGGHMFPQVEPALCADAIQRALASSGGQSKARL